MRSAAFWMMVTAVLILAFIWQERKFYMPKPKPWPTETGKIVSNQVRPVETEESQRYRVDLVYEYKNGDSVLEGNRIRPNELTYPKKELAERAAKVFPVGKEVKVYVNPVEKSQPRSVLVWEFPDILSPVVVIIIVLMATSIVLYLMAEYQRFKK
jgi:Protein of unknown function (DUF3592)